MIVWLKSEKSEAICIDGAGTVPVETFLHNPAAWDDLYILEPGTIRSLRYLELRNENKGCGLSAAP